MSIYFVGDVHGCFEELKNALNTIKFNITKDILFLAGDLVYRGPNSLKVLQFLYNIRENVKIVLGNHDLRLLSECIEKNKNRREDWISDFLQIPNFEKIFDWIRNQPVLRVIKKEKIILVHAGIHPEWDLHKMFEFSKKIKKILQDEKKFFSLAKRIFRKSPTQVFWNDNLKEIEKIQFIINVFTRIRYCFLDGSLAMNFKECPTEISSLTRKPWFSLLKKIKNNYKIIFGHWSSLAGYKKIPKNIYNIDSGCCWGGGLSVLNLKDNKLFIIPSSSSIQKLIYNAEKESKISK